MSKSLFLMDGVGVKGSLFVPFVGGCWIGWEGKGTGRESVFLFNSLSSLRRGLEMRLGIVI